MPLVFAASLLIALSNASGPSSDPALDLPAVGHLAQGGGVERGRHLGVDRLDRGEDRDLGLLTAERDGQVDRVLADVHLVFQRRGDVDRGVRDDEHLVIRGHVHQERVADAAAGPQPLFAGDDRREQFVGVQAALHQHFGAALADEGDGLLRRGVAVGQRR